MKGSETDARRKGRGAIAGLLAAATALGVGQLVAGLTGASGSPVVAVGELQIDFTPPWLKNFAIANFGSDDKLILVGGILVVIALFAALIGMEATRRLWVGMAGLAVFAVIGLTAAATRPTASFASLLPTVAATAAAAAVLRILIPLACPPPAPSGHVDRRTSGRTPGPRHPMRKSRRPSPRPGNWSPRAGVRRAGVRRAGVRRAGVRRAAVRRAGG